MRLLKRSPHRREAYACIIGSGINFHEMVPFHPKKCAHLGLSISPAISVRSLDLWNIGCIWVHKILKTDIFSQTWRVDFYVCSHSNGMWNDSSWLLYVTVIFVLKLGFLSWSVSDKKCLSWSLADPNFLIWFLAGPKNNILVRGGPRFSNLVRGGTCFLNFAPWRTKLICFGPSRTKLIWFVADHIFLLCVHTSFRPKSKQCTLFSDQNPSCAHLLQNFGPPRTKRTKIKKNGPPRTKIKKNGPPRIKNIRTNLENFDQPPINLANFGPPRTNFENFDQPPINLANFGPPRTNLENFGPARTNLENLVRHALTYIISFVW